VQVRNCCTGRLKSSSLIVAMEDGLACAKAHSGGQQYPSLSTEPFGENHMDPTLNISFDHQAPRDKLKSGFWLLGGG